MKVNLKKISIIYMLSISLFVYPTSYHDILVNNHIIKPGAYPCEPRYKLIKPFLNKYKRPFTVLDIGAAQGYFSLKTATDYKHAVTVMIESGYGETKENDNLLEICKLNTKLKNIIFLKSRITPEDLNNLSLCEHFDVVYALNILHHFGHQGKEIVDAVLSLGDYVIIELPSYASEDVKKYVAEKAPLVIAKFNRPSGITATMRLYQKPKTEIKLKAFKYPSQNIYKIKSTFTEKKIYKLDKNQKIISSRNWMPGINFCTFKAFNGIWPDKKTLINNLNSNKSQFINAIFPQDILIDGLSFKLIQSHDISKLNAQECFKNIINIVDKDINKNDIKALY